MTSERTQHRRWARLGLAALTVTLAGTASAAWWKGLNWSKNGSLNDDYWDGFGITYEDWYASTPQVDWASTEAIFEKGDNPLETVLTDDFVCRNVTLFGGAEHGSLTVDLQGHTFSTVHDGWGFFFKGRDGELTFKNGTIAVRKQFNVGDDLGCGNTCTFEDATLAYPGSLTVGRSSNWQPSTNNTVVIGRGARVLLGTGPYGDSWGYAVGENPGEDGNTLVIRDGGAFTNLVDSALVGRQSSCNTLLVTDGGVYRNEKFQQLGQQAWDWNTTVTNNLIKAERGGVIELGSGFYIGDGANPAVMAGNTVWAGDGGRIVCGGDVNVSGSGNAFVVSNGYLCCNSLHSSPQGDTQGYHGTSFLFAGASPQMEVWFYFSLRSGARVAFDIPAGGYQTTPLTIRNGCPMNEDTELTVTARDFQKSLRQGGTTRLCLINADMDGSGDQKLSVPGDDESQTKLHALVERWNAAMPHGVKVALSDDLCSLWAEVSKAGLMIYVR